MKKLLICPKCRSELAVIGGTMKCKNNHSYDIAKQGYVNLVLGNSGSGGDDKEMCRSRHDFHSRDYYKCLSGLLAEICVKNNFKCILDAGCGEGYYIRKIRDAYSVSDNKYEALCGIDLAKEAVSIAAKSEKNFDDSEKIQYAVAGIFDMPVCDNSIDCLLSVFAPVPDKEAFRVLKKDGIMIVVSPGEKHLEGLKKAVYDNIYDNEVSEKEFDGFTLYHREYAEDTIMVTGPDILNLFHMTPYYWKTSEKDAEKLTKIDSLTTKIEFVVSFYKKI